jgi:hypothetical protein
LGPRRRRNARCAALPKRGAEARAPRAQANAKKKEIAARLGRPVLETNQYEDVRPRRKPKPCALRSRASHARHSRPQIIACDVINPDHIRVTFDTIGGLEDIKRALVRAAKRWRHALRPAPHA